MLSSELEGLNRCIATILCYYFVFFFLSQVFGRVRIVLYTFTMFMFHQHGQSFS